MKLRMGMPEEVGMSSEGIRRAEEVVKRIVESGNTPSVVELIARDGVIVSYKAFGTNGREEGAEPLAVDSLFPVFSITKSFTAACIMILLERGLVGLSRPVSEYLPHFKGEEMGAICVHHLLTHTSGMNDEVIGEYHNLHINDSDFPLEWKSSWTKGQVYCASCVKLDNPPGKVMSYCNTGYGALGEIIEKVSHMSYVEFVETQLFQPLEMKDSCFIPTEDLKKRLVKRNAPALWDDYISSDHCINNTSPSGGVLSTVMDTAIFCAMLQNMGSYNGVRILSPATVKEMTRNHIPGVTSEYRGEIFPEAYWGLGLGINGGKKDGGDLFSSEAYSHWGAAGVFFCVDPVYRTIQIYFSVEVDHQVAFKQIYADAFNNAAIAAIDIL